LDNVDDVEEDNDVSEELLDPVVGVREVSDSSARPLATLPTDGLVSTEEYDSSNTLASPFTLLEETSYIHTSLTFPWYILTAGFFSSL
jgi:hypothetical protein